VKDMQMQHIELDIEEKIIEEINKMATLEFKTRDKLIKEALVSYVERFSQLKEIKRIATTKFLEGKLNFDDFARIVGYENAVLVKNTDMAMKESIQNAKRDFT
jgi:metal-responsive CopG/Arc/MetJ family transcriptional regulator